MGIHLKDKIVFITGASSGIGKAAAYQFASLGAKLILTARRMDRLSIIAKELKAKWHTEVLPITLDVQDKDQVQLQIETLPTPWRDIYLLINNAGLALDSTNIQDGHVAHWEQMIDTNIKGLLYVTRAILPRMIARGEGHIINIGSIAGHEYYPTGNIYGATKHAVKAISKSMQIDLLGTGLRVSEVDPGAVHTEFSEVRWKDKVKSDQFYQSFTPLTAEDIADAIVYCATRPIHANVSEMILLPTVQASANHIFKKGVPTKNLFD
ncbi:MAG: SDR family NAD(P)-dependent oxidoreductase [Legionellales bacterium]|nr:SDR family NAD(P)-dependent oxidoreductase [Legionellales bacterium]